MDVEWIYVLLYSLVAILDCLTFFQNCIKLKLTLNSPNIHKIHVRNGCRGKEVEPIMGFGNLPDDYGMYL